MTAQSPPRHSGEVGPQPTVPLARWVVWSIGLAFVVLGLFAALADGQLLFFDEPIQAAVQGVGLEGYGSILEALGWLGSRYVTAPLAVLAALVTWRRCRQLSVMFIVALVASVGLELILKAIVDRPRPIPEIGFGASFPSGHVIATVAFFGLLPTWVHVVTGGRKAATLALLGALLIALAVGVSRIYLSAHWPSDVVGALLVGVVFVTVAESAVHRRWPLLKCQACVIHPAETPTQ